MSATPAEIQVKQEICQLIQSINESWLLGDLPALAQFFHRDMVILSPDFAQRRAGRDACVSSYEEFLSSAIVHQFESDPPTVDWFGNTTVATCAFTVTFEVDGQVFTDGGQDIFVFVRDEGRWQVAWRTLIPSPPGEAEDAPDR